MLLATYGGASHTKVRALGVLLQEIPDSS
jgi:hypothetical protein